jgi:trehalose synthase
MNQYNLVDYQKIVGEEAIAQLHQLSRPLSGMQVVHVNSTKQGGGVAEILAWLIPLMRVLRIDASWEVIEGDEMFFSVTKSFHNGLQGLGVNLSTSQYTHYDNILMRNAEKLRAILEEADFVFIHDPQPAGLLALCPGRKGKWVWRCHIDASHPDRAVWNFVRGKVKGFDASIFSMPQYAQPLPHPQFIIAPSIDPLSAKNFYIPDDEVKAIVTELGLDVTRPIITQVSRFDRFKDPLGVIKAFKLLGQRSNAQLVLAGGGAADDPEGAAIFAEVQEASKDDSRITLLLLPNDAHKTINALQRASTIVTQKSLQEGFGLTVTEALWKYKPVIGGNTGGIRLQVHNHHTGFLVDSPEGAALRMRELLRQPEKREEMGKVAHQFVKENFLLTRHLREYLTLMFGLHTGLQNRLITTW